MRVDREQPDGLGISALLLPDLTPAQQEALDAGVSVDDRCRFTVEGDLVRLDRDAEAAEVADVLTDREGAVDVVFLVEAARGERVVLLDQTLGALLEGRAIVFCPPVP